MLEKIFLKDFDTENTLYKINFYYQYFKILIFFIL